MNAGVNSNKDSFEISWMQKGTKCWVYQPNEEEGDIYLKGTIEGKIPLTINKANSKVNGVLDIGRSFQAKAIQIQKCRSSNSIERDLIDMDIINAPEVLQQLKKRLLSKKIYTFIWNSLIIVNPFKFIPEVYGEKMLATYFEHIFLNKEELKKHEPHIYSFTMDIMSNIEVSNKTQVMLISGESGSGKTQANKEVLYTISYVCSKMHQRSKMPLNTPQSKILSCDPILQTFGNAKTIKNDNSSRFGKLITLTMDGHKLIIHEATLKNYFLEKTRIISQNQGERNFHIFYQLLAYLPDEQKSALRLKSNGRVMRLDDFRYLTNRTINTIDEDKTMWKQLNQAFSKFGFSSGLIKQIWSVIAAILLMGNLKFEESINDNEPCLITNSEVADSIAFLLGLPIKQFVEALTTHRRNIGTEVIVSPVLVKLCTEGCDSVSKAMYEFLFTWLVEELNRRLNYSHSEPADKKVLKLLDIYGFEVFDRNSFEQLCVNFTNEKIHQIYLQQIFINQKQILMRQGLQSLISKLDFTDNIKVIQLLDIQNRSIFNLLEESCSLNVRDDDFLINIKKIHQKHEHFPQSNTVNTRKSFIIKHTPGDIQYMAEGFREKNKDLIREDLVLRFSQMNIEFIAKAFKEKYDTLKQEGNKRFLSLKIRRQVRELVTDMSTNTDVYFVRCIKPNENKDHFRFVDRICYNQIKYLGILETIQIRKQAYHIRTPYSDFYKKYGILENNLKALIALSQNKVQPHTSKQLAMRFLNDLNVHHNLDYQFGRQRIFLKISAQHRLDTLLHKKLELIEYASTRIKAHYRYYKLSKKRQILKDRVLKIQLAIKRYLIYLRINRKKVSVRKIQNAWIKYHKVFFARKKSFKLRKLEKYIKTRIEQLKMQKKIEAVTRTKHILRSIAEGHQISKKVEQYRMLKRIVTENVIPKSWDLLKQKYVARINKYLKGLSTRKKNVGVLMQVQQISFYRLWKKYTILFEDYLKGFQSTLVYQKKIASIIKIQSFFRMVPISRNFKNLRFNAILIQKNWRKYYYDKMFNLEYTKRFFEDGPGGQLALQTQYWKKQLYRDVSVKDNQSKVERVLFNNERVKMDKIGLFYYLLDFQILTDLGAIYPQFSWIDHYTTLFEQCWQKGNPIQMLDVSDTQTIASTLNKAYTWGNVHYIDFHDDSKTYLSWKNFNHHPITGKIHKVQAHNNFAVVQVENADPVVIGDQKLYEEDSSAKEWKTLGETYIIINGMVLTLKKVEFSRLTIPEKVVQLSCGMAHCMARTSLRKIYAWGDNSNGQLGMGHYNRVKKPQLLDWFSKHAIQIHQTATSAYGSVVLDSNNRIFWWGTNGTIENVCIPKEVYLFEKTSFLDNPKKYSIVRIVASWSKSLSIIGVTVASHEGIFKTSQNQVMKKTFQNLISKWNQDILTVMPPYIQSISGYFQERLMPKPKVEPQNKNVKELEHQRIREKLLSEITLMEEAERALLKERKKF